ncbi:MAG: DNA internalization-related competence protein ComEC/Rec2 [Gammaproteobacteria bacterium]|jgi:competence protein ComEC|nr:DNA internalization-related competence protein ComEC/Rec2 [Gammaproteobacteria bacterium]
MAGWGGQGWRSLFAFALGCLIVPWLPVLPGAALMLVLAAAGGIGCAFKTTRLPSILLLGGVWFMAGAHWEIDGQWPTDRAGEVLAVSGTVIDLPQRRDWSTRFLLQVDRLPDDTTLPRRVLASWYRPSERIEPGSRWRMDLRLEPPSGRVNFGGFDYERWLLTGRIGASGAVRGEPVRLADSSGGQLADRGRQRLAEVMQSETASLDVAALKRALGVADRSRISDELGQRLRQTGTAHLLAISGLHVGMVAALAGALSGWLATPLALVWRRLDRRRLAVVGGLIAATAYAALAGWTLPTQRALVMLGVIAVALLARRAIAPGHALLLALVAVLVFDPLAPLASGFWLSFAAVGVLVWAFAWRPAGGRRLSGLLRAQLVIMLGLMPLAVGVFGQIVPVALLANLLAIPLVGLVVLPALLLDMVSILAGWPASGIGAVSDWGLGLLLAALAWLHELDFAFFRLAPGPAWSLLPAAAGALWLLAPPGWPARWLGVLLLMPLLWPAPPELEDGELEIRMLDVGNGLAVLLRTPETAWLYDTGPGDGEGGDLIGSLLPDLLNRLDAGIERVIVSHGHRGHAGGAGSLPALLGDVPVHSPGADIGKPCLAGQQWRHGAYTFSILHPSPGLPDLGANSSCVLHVTGPGGSVLLTGGIDSAVELRLQGEYGGPPADVLVVSSGGHRKASGRGFLEAVRPDLALVSVERYDRFSRPHAEVVERLRSAGVPRLATADCGAIVVRLRPGADPRVFTALGRHPRFWRPAPGCP